MKILITGLLAASLSLNFFFWWQRSNRAEAAPRHEEHASEVLPQPTASPAPVDADREAETRELARLRNEVGQLRTQLRESELSRAKEAGSLQAQLAATAKKLANAEKGIADALKLSPEEVLQAKQDAQSSACINNMKQLGLAARIFANENNDRFPPHIFAMTNEIGSVKLLYCPAEFATPPVTDWSQVDPASVSYRLMNPLGTDNEPWKTLFTCRVHQHVGLSDGSVQRKR